ncbi:hypothetical protein P5G50_16755 [Leifsonia sp. F6_8S_P_1B]|uniref:Lipoprotein antigen n=1 Tax=Leifsonia williamsii TaxID=3035919 RepID=A0ABT8KF64_9MICO|nr:hypothetical protein [Leifsonia williamsii]MDN4616099.1 hypothetical protein [Leifsonia williamsii]
MTLASARPTLRRRLLTTVAAAGIALTALTACTAPSADAKSGSTSSKVTTAPGTAKGYVGAAKDVTIEKCDASKSPASFSGTVTNPEKTKQSYRIYVSVLAGDATLGIAQVNVDDVEPKAKKSWSGTSDSGAENGRCVLRVERTPSK